MTGLSSNGQIFNFDFTVSTYDCTPKSELSASKALDYLEEAAGAHLSCFHMSTKELLEIDTVFLLSAIELKFLRSPHMNEKLSAKTWQRTMSGVRYIRDGEIVDEGGNQIAQCVENWFIANPVTHKILRPTELPVYKTLPSYEGKGFETKIISIDFPDECTFAGTRKIVYSDLDCNHHVHNTRYAEIAGDFFPDGLKNSSVSLIRIIFSKEASLDDEISIYTSVRDNSIYFKGLFPDGNKCFLAEIKTF